MEPVVIAAKFAAYVSHCHGKPDSAHLRRQARQFAQTNWLQYLPEANEGWGRLLLRLARNPKIQRRNPGHQRSLQLAAV